jgi:hypothetical protein
MVCFNTIILVLQLYWAYIRIAVLSDTAAASFEAFTTAMFQSRRLLCCDSV